MSSMNVLNAYVCVWSMEEGEEEQEGRTESMTSEAPSLTMYHHGTTQHEQQQQPQQQQQQQHRTPRRSMVPTL